MNKEGEPIEEAPGLDATMREIEAWAERRAIALENGNVAAAARRLGISLKTMYNHERQRRKGGMTC